MFDETERLEVQGHGLTSQQRLIFPVQDLCKLSDGELWILECMAGVFAGQAGAGAMGSRVLESVGIQEGKPLSAYSQSMSRVGVFEGTRVTGWPSLWPADRRFRGQGAVLESPGPKPGSMLLWERMVSLSRLGDFILLLFC